MHRRHIVLVQVYVWGTRWLSWLRHCAKSRKVAGSIDLVPPAVAVGSTQSLTEMSARNISWVVETVGS
jgi:hypothetical protein